MTLEAFSVQRRIRDLIRRVEEARGRRFDFQNFDDRLMVQKIAYLLSKAGIVRGIAFNYYHRGPYSPELLRMLKNTPEHTTLEESEFSQMRETRVDLDPEDEKRFEKIIELLKKKNWDAEWLELFTSALFFTELEPNPKKPNWERVELVLSFKKGIKRDRARQIVSEVKEYVETGLFNL